MAKTTPGEFIRQVRAEAGFHYASLLCEPVPWTGGEAIVAAKNPVADGRA